MLSCIFTNLYIIKLQQASVKTSPMHFHSPSALGKIWGHFSFTME